VLRKIFGPKREVGSNCIMRSFVTCTFLQSIIRMIKSRKMRSAGQVAQMGEKRNARMILVGKPEGKRHWEDQEVGGWTILN
jgi:hypothetical protein